MQIDGRLKVKDHATGEFLGIVSAQVAFDALQHMTAFKLGDSEVFPLTIITGEKVVEVALYEVEEQQENKA